MIIRSVLEGLGSLSLGRTSAALWATLGSIVLAGCGFTNTSTEMSSFTDPDYRNRAAFKSVMVLGDQMGIEDRQMAETTMVSALGSYGIYAVRSIDYAPPTRGDAVDQIADAIQRTQVDALLVLSLADQSTSETYIPPTYHPGTSNSTVSMYGNTGTVTTYTNPGYTTGGYSIEKPRASYAATLFDTSDFRIAWQADGSSRGNAFATFNDLTLSASHQTVQSVIGDGLFGPRVVEEPPQTQ